MEGKRHDLPSLRLVNGLEQHALGLCAVREVQAMSDLSRYRPASTPAGAVMLPSEEGEWVRLREAYALTNSATQKLRAELAALLKERDNWKKEAFEQTGNRDYWKQQYDEKQVELAALREAAGKVKCRTCDGSGKMSWWDAVAKMRFRATCPDCADLRRILGVTS